MLWATTLAGLAVLLWIWALKKPKPAERSRLLLDFAIAMVATFCGVAWAIALETRANDKMERMVVVGLLKAANDDVVRIAAELAEYAAQDTTMSPSLSDHFAMVAPIPRSHTLDAIMSNDVVLRRISPMSLRFVAAGQGIVDAAEALAKASGEPAAKRRAFGLSGSSYFAIHHSLENEIKWHNHEISEVQRDGMSRHWITAEVNGDAGPGTWREFLAAPAVRESLLEQGVLHFPRSHR